MDIEEALEKCRQGKKIKRKEWQNMYLMYIDILDSYICYRQSVVKFIYDIAIISSNGWIIIYNETNRQDNLSFIEMLNLLKKGWIAALPEWSNDEYIMVQDNDLVHCYNEQYNFTPTYQCLISNDWEII